MNITKGKVCNMRNRVNLAICAIVKNEAEYILEWLEFHKLVGVQRFYIYDNDSCDGLVGLLAPYIAKGEVVYNSISLRPGQLPAYTHYIQAYRFESVWTAFIDADEFLFGTKIDNLNELLHKYQQYDGLGVNWLVFGSSNHQSKPQGLVIENYTRRSLDSYNANRHLKMIVKNQSVIAPINPHVFLTINNNSVNEKLEQIELNHETKVNCVKDIRLNHYVCKSVTESRAKWEQGRSDTNEKRDWSFFAERLAQNDVEDLCISRFLKPLKKKLGLYSTHQSRIFNVLKSGN